MSLGQPENVSDSSPVGKRLILLEELPDGKYLVYVQLRCGLAAVPAKVTYPLTLEEVCQHLLELDLDKIASSF